MILSSICSHIRAVQMFSFPVYQHTMFSPQITITESFLNFTFFHTSSRYNGPIYDRITNKLFKSLEVCLVLYYINFSCLSKLINWHFLIMLYM